MSQCSPAIGQLFVLASALSYGWGLRVADAADATSDAGWTELAGDEASQEWRPDHPGWTTAGAAALRPDNEQRLDGAAGNGVLLSDGSSNMYTTEEFGDVELTVEFMIPRGSNSGVKLNGLYEIQIRDTHEKDKPTADDCGGVYPRAELGPPYRYLDEGVPPRVNAAKPAGEWQTLEITFTAPRVDATGKKTQNARFVRVALNGQVIHEDVELKWPTGHAWDEQPETPRGPLMLQGDHGAVAFRKVAVRPLGKSATAAGK